MQIHPTAAVEGERLKPKEGREVLFDLTGIHYVNLGKRELPKVAKGYHAWAMITSMLINVNFACWGNQNLNYGMGPVLIEFVHIMLFMVMFNTIMGELTTSMPNAGGLNGFVRLAFGHLPAFICAVFELIGIVTNFGFATGMFALYILGALNDLDAEGNYDATTAGLTGFIILLLICILFRFSRGRYLWDFSLAILIFSIAVILIGLIGAMIHGNFHNRATNLNEIILYDDDADRRRLTDLSTLSGYPSSMPTSQPSSYPEGIWFTGSYQLGFYKSLTDNYWRFLGIEFSSLVAGEIIEVEKSFPTALALSTATEYISFIVSTFANASLIGLVALNTHFALVDSLATFLHIPKQLIFGFASFGALSSFIGIFFALSRLLFHLSRKGLMPEIFSRLHHGMPTYAIYAATVLGFLSFSIVGSFDDIIFERLMSALSIVSTAVVTMLVSATYLKLRINHPEINRPFRSPFGLIGGVFCLSTSILLFLFGCLRDLQNVPLIFYTLIVGVSVWSVYFFIVTKNYIVLDSDEKKAIVASLNIDALLTTEFGYGYIEGHCQHELNCESLYCLVSLRRFYVVDVISEEELSTFVMKYIVENAEFQVNISDKLRKQTMKWLSEHNSLRSVADDNLRASLIKDGKGSRRLRGFLRVLRLIDKELVDLINSDIIPRWKARECIVENFLRNVPYQNKNGGANSAKV